MKLDWIDVVFIVAIVLYAVFVVSSIYFGITP